ncbi:MAG TPA: DEAD/DEAH box helicase [Mycobacteriales bacterium]|jgi:hypothetical protein|nr:DEAD/DEAH box helicase [Mycobacteriales bacterium]
MTIDLERALARIDAGVRGDDIFSVLQAIGFAGATPERNQARDALIRLLEQRDAVPDDLADLLHGLVREHGLFPYLREEDVDELPLADLLAYEIHRPAQLPGGRDIVFHAEQAVVYQRLLAGENVVLSAPTSFGKSLIIDAVLAARPDWHNVVVVVPTIALIDEMRRRFAALQDRYKIITHGSQEPAERNLYVMTQERLLDLPHFDDLDFFAIDEFYKLDPDHSDDRASVLNIVFDDLRRTGAQFYLLGPNISGLTDATARDIDATFITTDYTTVATDVRRETATGRKAQEARLPEVCHELGPQTMIFCSGPARMRTVARWLLEAGVGGGHDLDEAAAWVADAYHPEWLVARALAAGIGMHHGRLPRALAHHMVRLFNEGRLPYLLVTSTLIEGVNTTARNVVILDKKIGNVEYDYFTFANIRGRSGRMKRHYVGTVVVFNEPPTPTALTVDVPVVSQGKGISDEVLIQMSWDELNDANRARMRPFYQQDAVPVDTLRANKGIAPQRQLDVATMLRDKPRHYRSALAWTSLPTTAQVKQLADVLYEIAKPKSRSRTVISAAQLAGRLNTLRYHRGSIAALAANDMERWNKTADEAVEDALDFARWAQFHVPRALGAVERLAVEAYGRGAVPNTRGFARQVEGMFQAPLATVLEEFGLPLPVTSKLDRFLRLDNAEDLDTALARLRAVPPNPGGLDPFEREMLQDTQAAL